MTNKKPKKKIKIVDVKDYSAWLLKKLKKKKP